MTVRHPYCGIKVAFATMHGKEQILAPLFRKNFEAQLQVPKGIDTDKYGTFSGEVRRVRDIKSVLRAKALEGAELLGSRFSLASEGSFSSHPLIPMIGSNQENLLFLDLENKIEIHSAFTSTQSRTEYIEAACLDDVINFCQQLDCGPQGLIVKPQYDSIEAGWIQKGLVETKQVVDAFLSLKKELNLEKVWIETDNRAHMNPKRQEVIFKAGEKLMENLASLCPGCRSPGFQMVDFLRGLLCRDCGYESDKPIKEIWGCPSAGCDYQEQRGRLDGIKALDPAQCDWCNP